MSSKQGVAQAPTQAADAERDISALIKRAARFADDRKFLEWMDLFAEDGRYGAITYENYISSGLHLFRDKGKRALHERVSFLMGLWQVPRGKTVHLVTNCEIEVDASAASASATSNFLMTRTGDMEHSKLHACGRYYDKFVRGDGGWFFSERTVVVDSNMLPPEFTELL